MEARRLSALFLTLLAAALLTAACGDDENDSGGASGSSSTAASDTPAPLKAGGDFLFCTDVPYPPAESQVGSDFEGYEIDIAREVSDRIGVEAQFQKTGFDGIIGALNAKQCDGIISSMNSTDERKKEVNFVDYMEVGQSLLVPADDADEVTDLTDLGGQTVAVQTGTTLGDAIKAANEDIEGEKISLKSFPSAQDAVSALSADQVDAFFTDSPVAADYVNKQPDAFAFGGEPVDPLPVGIALRKSDTDLRDAVQDAVDAMYEDGTMKKLLDKWKVADFMLESGSSGDEDAGPEGTSTTEG